MKLKEYDPDVLNQVHQVELMILKDFIQICEENNLSYSVYGGSMIGAIRHKGFIPWDDDIDVIMFREDYEKFEEIFLSSNNDKYELLTNDIEHDYCYPFTKFMLKNTTFEEEWMEQFSFHIGFNIDIFILDDTNDNKFKRFYITRKGLVYNRLLISSGVRLDYLPFFTRIISQGLNTILNFLNITPYKLTQKYLKFLRKNSHKNSEFVFDFSANFAEFPLIFYREDFKDLIQVEFEDMYVSVPRNYDRVLKIHFGDYMTLPPEDKRVNHAIDIIDFGPYQK